MATQDSGEPWCACACARLLPEFPLLALPPLGRGAFAIVVAATHGPTGAAVALKVSDKTTPQLSDSRVLHRARAEGRVLQKLSHGNIMKCFGVVEDDEALALVLSCEGGESLAALVSTQGAMAETMAAPVILQLARALRHCHQRKIAHRDVKLDNCVYDAATGRVVLCDFGLALIVRSVGSRLDVRCGSPEYCAPELIDSASKGYYGPAVDMWALGVAAYTLLCAAFPFGTAQTKICRGAYDKGALDVRGVSGSAREWIGWALTVDPNSVQRVNRISSFDACRHAWLKPHDAAADAAADAAGSAAERVPEALIVAVAEAQRATEAARRSDGPDQSDADGGAARSARGQPSVVSAMQNGAGSEASRTTHERLLEVDATARLLALSTELADDG